jgi:hypothetical protein
MKFPNHGYRSTPAERRIQTARPQALQIAFRQVYLRFYHTPQESAISLLRKEKALKFFLSFIHSSFNFYILNMISKINQDINAKFVNFLKP